MSRMLSGDPALSHVLSHSPAGSFMSTFTRSRIAGSFSRSTHASCPPSCTHGGITASSPVELAW